MAQFQTGRLSRCRPSVLSEKEKRAEKSRPTNLLLMINAPVKSGSISVPSRRGNFPRSSESSEISESSRSGAKMAETERKRLRPTRFQTTRASFRHFHSPEIIEIETSYASPECPLSISLFFFFLITAIII